MEQGRYLCKKPLVFVIFRTDFLRRYLNYNSTLFLIDVMVCSAFDDMWIKDAVHVQIRQYLSQYYMVGAWYKFVFQCNKVPKYMSEIIMIVLEE